MMKTAKPKQHKVKSATSQPKARTAKQLAADQKKAERLLARETKQKESDNRFTSPKLIGAVTISFGAICFDPCWHVASVVEPKRYLDVRRGDNGLRDKWSGRLAFVNPPWSAQDKWLKRAYNQWLKGNVGIVVCLVPAATDSKFFHEKLAKYADVYFLEGRPRFSKEDGSSQATMRSTMIVMFGATEAQKARFAKLVRGSWWLPYRAPFMRSEQFCVNSNEFMFSLTGVSCAALNEENPRTVFCAQSFGSPNPVSC